jgi:hypothetical protein
MKTIAQQLNIKEFPFRIKDSNGDNIYYENSNGFWWKQEFDSNGNKIYFEDSYGTIVDNRPKIVELTMDEIAKMLRIDVNNLKIKK